eukprot:gene6501-8936_t
MRRTIALFSSKHASIISIPMNLGQPNYGLDLAPGKLIDHGLLRLLGSNGWRLKQLAPLIIDSKFDTLDVTNNSYNDRNAKNCNQVGSVCKSISNHIINDQDDSSQPNNHFQLILGGDHCISIGTIPALKRNKDKFGIVWVDAHGDINTPETSSSGNMHGMPIAFLLGLVENANKLPGFEWFKPCIKPEDIVYIGLRDLDKGEKLAIKKLGIKAFTMYEVDKYGIGKVMDMCMEYLSDKEHIHLSFDIDALDPFFAPHTGTAVTGGLTYREGVYICEVLSESGKLSSMEIVEVDPSQHKTVDTSITVETALTLVGSAMGSRILPL